MQQAPAKIKNATNKRLIFSCLKLLVLSHTHLAESFGLLTGKQRAPNVLFIHRRKLAATSSSSSSSFFTSTKNDTASNNDNDVFIMPRATTKYKVAVVGAGAVGSYYGARLWEAGHSVEFFTRSLPDDVNGLFVTSTDGDIHIPASQWRVFHDTSQMQVADWVVVALKSTSLDQIPRLILPLVSPSTRVLVIMNGLIEDDLIRMIRETTTTENEEIDCNSDAPLDSLHTLYGGMALICSNRLGPARIDHSYAGLLSAGVAVSQSKDAAENEQAFRQLFQGAKVPLNYDEDLLRGRWKKMVWNLPFNGISVAMGGITVDQIVHDPGLRQLAIQIMAETVATGNADLQHKYGKHDNGQSSWQPLGKAEMDQMMELSDSMGPYKTSTMLDLTNRRAMEVRYMFREPVKRAKKLNVPVPHLDTIVAMIEAYQRQYNL